MATGDTSTYYASLYYTYEELPYDDSGIFTSFGLHWNETGVDPLNEWDENVTNAYNSIQAGDKPGTILIGKKVTETDVETWKKQLSSINTGDNQSDPSLTLDTSATDPTFIVSFGTQAVETSALEDIYKKYDSDDYEDGVNSSIATLVANVVTSLIKTKSKYNFKKIDTNREFLTKNLTVFRSSLIRVEEIEKLKEVDEDSIVNNEMEAQD